MQPMEGLMPLSRMVLPKSRLTYWAPWSLWWMQPSGGFLLAMAILSASSASSAVMRGPMDQPTTMRDHTSMTAAR